MKLDIVYARVSTDEQAKENKTSLDEQIETCIPHLKNLGYNNIQVYREDYSGYSLDRPELDRIKELVLSGKVRSLTFARVDRLTRKGAHLDTLREGYLIPLDVEVYSVNDLGKFEWTPVHIHLQNSLANFGELWGHLLKIVMESGRVGLVKRGNTMALGRAPLGYTEIKNGDGSAYFEINELEAKIVRMIFDYYVDRDMSTWKIASELSRGQIPTYTQLRNGTPFLPDGNSNWHAMIVRHILVNPTYDGRWFYKKTKTVKVYDQEVRKLVKRKVSNSDRIMVEVPRLVSSETWELAQEKLEKNKVGRKPKNKYLLSGRVTCHCGKSMQGEPQTRKRQGKKKTYFYYRCSDMKNYVQGNCTQRVNAKKLDKIAWEWLCSVLSDKDKLTDKVENYIKEQEEEVDKLRIKLEAIEKALEVEHKQHDTLLSSYLKLPELGQAKMIAEIEQLEKKIKENEAERGVIKRQVDDFENTVFEIQRLIQVYDELPGGRISPEIPKGAESARDLFLEVMSAMEDMRDIETPEARIDFAQLVTAIRTKRELNFEDKQEIMKKFDLTATVKKLEDGLYVHLVCRLGQDLCLLNSKP